MKLTTVPLQLFSLAEDDPGSLKVNSPTLKQNKELSALCININIKYLIINFSDLSTHHNIFTFLQLFGQYNLFLNILHPTNFIVMTKSSEPKESEPKESEPKESEPKESEPKESEPKESEPKESEKMSDFVMALLQALSRFIDKQADVSFSSAMKRAQDQVQNERCLTDRGKIFLLGFLQDPVWAATYLSIKESNLRDKWLRKQLERAEEDMQDLFRDLEVQICL
ncbi:hypothetical protein K3495_g13590 [Podosphaera aphanis]|nr:hypothetical protein K3495_g13590 [Podosphaera aphanis]